MDTLKQGKFWKYSKVTVEPKVMKTLKSSWKKSWKSWNLMSSREYEPCNNACMYQFFVHCRLFLVLPLKIYQQLRKRQIRQPTHKVQLMVNNLSLQVLTQLCRLWLTHLQQCLLLPLSHNRVRSNLRQKWDLQNQGNILKKKNRWL